VTPDPVDTVVFDLGGVLIQWDPRVAFADTLAADEIEPFLAEVGFMEWNKALDGGRPMAEAEADIDERFPHRAGVMAAYRRNFRSTLVGEVPGTADIVRELADAGIRLLALTNWSAESFPHAREMFEVLGRFEAFVVSGEERVTKPDPRIFTTTIERHGLDPARTAYIDDSAANVAAAGDLGLRALQFTDAATLRHDLAELGLPVGTGDPGAAAPAP
jgi:2-haloacid dehalogenase